MTAERPDHRVTFAVVLAGVSAYALLQSLVLPVLPTIQHNLHTSQSGVTWVLTAYLLSASIFTPILGRVGDMIGKQKMFVVGLVALAVGSLMGALAPSIGIMIAARAIQGIGGGVLPLAFGIVRDEFPASKVSTAIGVVAALAAVGGGLGIVLAGPIVDVLDWHWLFWFPMIFVSIAAVAARVLVPESRVRTPGRINVPAAVLLSSWLVVLLVAVSEGPTWGWRSASVLGLAAGALVIALVWVRVEIRSDHPLIDMRMMRLPAVWTTNLVAFLFGMGMYSVFVFIPEFVQTKPSAGYGFGASVTRSGLFLLPMTVLMFFAGLVSGRFSHRTSPRFVLICSGLISIVGYLLLTVANSTEWVIYIVMASIGVGIGLALSAMSFVIVDSVPLSQTGVATAMNANIRTIGGSIGAGVMASIVASGAVHGVPRESGYTHGFAVLTGATVLAALACRDRPEDPPGTPGHRRRGSGQRRPGARRERGGLSRRSSPTDRHRGSPTADDVGRWRELPVRDPYAAIEAPRRGEGPQVASMTWSLKARPKPSAFPSMPNRNPTMPAAT